MPQNNEQEPKRQEILLSGVNVVGTLIIGALAFWLNIQIQSSNEKLNQIKIVQDEQKILLEQQRVLLEEQKVDLEFRLELFDRVIKSVSKEMRAPQETEVVLALVRTLPETEFSHALLTVLTTSSEKRIKEEAMMTLLKRGDTWFHRKYSKETEGYTDFDVYVCEPTLTNEGTGELLLSVLAAIDSLGDVGQVKVRRWARHSEFSNEELYGKTTIIVDEGHKESDVADELANILKGAEEIPDPEQAINRGKKSGWLVSVVICTTPDTRN